MGFFKDLFAGKKAQYDPYGTLNPEQRTLSKEVGNKLTSDLSAGPQYYTGTLTEEMSPEEQAYYNPTRASLMSGTLDRMMTEANDPVAQANAFRQGYSDPTYSNFYQNVAPGLIENAPASSSYRANLMARELNTLGNDLTKARFQYGNDVQNRALSAIGQTPTVQNYLSAPRVVKQAGLDRKYADFVRGNEAAQSNIDKALSFLGISTTTYQPGYSAGERTLATMGAIANMAGAIQGGGTQANANPSVAKSSGSGGVGGGNFVGGSGGYTSSFLMA